ncbi:MAG TPA: SMP-30/gluconolactonase/LRE family protein [Rubellimicrobium sp.]|jgi:sugar lactone lactonase YvrE|nr:SMP-30/gluconolactonase/LRE family protein [Rubellimicrobium sp.]
MIGPAIPLGPTRDGVGESPVWDANAGRLLWVDITGRMLREIDPAGGASRSWATDDFPTAVALVGPGRVALTLAGSVAILDLRSGALAPLASPEGHDPLMRLNEGRCDPSGQLWVSSMETNLTPEGQPRVTGPARGRLWRIGPDGEATAMADVPPLDIPNAMAWSPDGWTFHLADTVLNVIWAFDVDGGSGTLSRRRVFHEGGPGLPDGACMDADGHLWSARFGGGCLLRLDPEGRVEREVALPVTNPTACTFGGDRLSTLYVTSARFGLSEAALAANPLEGALLAIETTVAGLPEPSVRLTA